MNIKENVKYGLVLNVSEYDSLHFYDGTIFNRLRNGEFEVDSLYSTLEEGLEKLDKKRTSMKKEDSKYKFEAWAITNLKEGTENEWGNEVYYAFSTIDIDYIVQRKRYISEENLTKHINREAEEAFCQNKEKVKLDVLDEYKSRLNSFQINGKNYYTFEKTEDEIENCKQRALKEEQRKKEKEEEKKEKIFISIGQIDEFPIIREDKDIPEDATFYSDESLKIGNHFRQWKRLYDKNFGIIGDFRVLYTNICKNMREIVNNKRKWLGIEAYDLTDIGNGYSFVEKNEYTKEALICIVKSLKG